MSRKPPSFAWAPLAEARAAGLDDLMFLHWEESGGHKAALPLDIDWPAYRDLERRGQLKIGLLRVGGELVGYNVFFVYRPPRHRSTMWAINDGVYLDPDHRRGAAGIKLILDAEADLKAMGAAVVIYETLTTDLSSTCHRASLGMLFERLGYGLFGRSWSKAL